MALESTSFNHLVTDETLIQVDIIFDRDNCTHEIESIKLLDFKTQTEKADISDILLGYSSELMDEIERKTEDLMNDTYDLIRDGIFDFDE